MQKYALLSAVAIIIIVWSSGAARAAEVTLIAPGGIRAAVQQLIPAFERATGHKVEATFGSGGGTKERVIKGEPFDVPIVQPPLEPVIASGHVVAASETPLATVAVGDRRAHRCAEARRLDRRCGQTAPSRVEGHILSQCCEWRGRRRQLQRDTAKARHSRCDEAKDQNRPGWQRRNGTARQRRGRYRLNLHQRNHHRARRRGCRAAAAGHFDSDGSGGLCFRELEGTRGREGASALPVLARGCSGLQATGNAAGSLSSPPAGAGAKEWNPKSLNLEHGTLNYGLSRLLQPNCPRRSITLTQRLE